MKKIYFLLCLLAFTGQGLYAQFLPASIPESSYPVISDSCFRASGMACYSFDQVHFAPDNTNDDLFVYGWIARSIYTGHPTAHIGWKRKLTGTNTVLNQGAISLPGEINGMDVAFIAKGNDILVLAGYYKGGVGHVLDYYKWTINNLVLVQSVVLSNAPTYSPVQLDAHKLYGYAVTWADGGKVHVRAGRTDNGPFLACDAVLDLGGLALHNPDIAIGHPNSTGGLTLHFIATTTNNQTLVESTLPFDDVQLNCQPVMTPNIEDVLAGTNFSYPRIDCPDHFSTDDWSYVVADNNNVTAGVMAYNYAPVPKHYVLNDGSLGNLNIAGSPTYRLDYSSLALAYDNTGKNIYYCWTSGYPTPFFNGAPHAYVGVKLHGDGTLFNLDYWVMQQNPQNATGVPSIALSPQSDANADLYAIFTEYGPNQYQIDYKHIPWTLNSFRPGTTDIVPAEQQLISVFPNPFTSAVQIRNGGDNGSGLYEVTISDISGRGLYRLHGKLNDINRQLYTGNRLAPGMYFMEVQYKNQDKIFKIIKQ